MRPDWDAIVVGAGPAGAVAARELARRGLTVLLAERKAFPRAKVCGGCLNSHGVEVLERSGLGPALRGTGAPRLRSLRLSAGSRDLRLSLPGGAVVERASFDEALVQEAVAAGVEFASEHQVLPGAVDAHRRLVTLRAGGRDFETSAAVLVAADGLGGATLGAGGRAIRSSRLGAGALIEDDAATYEPGEVHMGVGKGGYVGLVRLGDGRLNLAAAFDPELVRAAGGLASAAREVLASAGLPRPAGLSSSRWSGTPPLTRRPRRPAAERVFAVGDASGYVEPFTGEGMAWALADAVAVADSAEEAATRWHPDLAWRWARRHRERTRAARWRCRTIALLLRRPRACRAIMGLLGSRPSWGRALAAAIHGVEVEA